MTNEENKIEERKETTEAKILNNKLEELRRWFESVGDCV
tara:strand:+ start:308 stop:424 length:117 start_codon:yes stop_codon:yes gene_type:complete